MYIIITDNRLDAQSEFYQHSKLMSNIHVDKSALSVEIIADHLYLIVFIQNC